MSWKDGFHAAVKKYLTEQSYRPITDIVDVISVESVSPSQYFCDTCGPDPEKVLVRYTRQNGKIRETEIYIEFGEFLNSLED